MRFSIKIETNLSNDMNLTTWNILKNRISPSNDTKEIIYWEENWDVLKDQINEEKNNRLYVRNFLFMFMILIDAFIY